ncbi:DUF4198 domain-containing protein [Novosphingobium guangzhouense]|uniref:Nickel uptake transporter family protein n=1 Tax=Novosphingobium guangzhouense TaxID=1850347 RepID=A0A2K2G6W0_9SPHN|nr:DUF4198 domain-containing protein [Novosphingobium guangzhouense]PNU06718.1 nickel uptake transporter family protein [Novosphingobium guangzhouense]
MAIKKFAPLLLLVAAPAAQAHEVWIERDGNGPARIYLGEPAEVLPEGGDPEFGNLKAPKLLPASSAAMTRKAGYLEVAVPAGDVRAHDDAVFTPWGAEGKKEGVAYYARAGRSEARAVMPLEIAPVAAGGTRFLLSRDGKPVADAAVTVITPDKWSKSIKTDAQGTFALPVREKGRYILTASQKDEGGAETSLGKVAVLHRIATTTFTID